MTVFPKFDGEAYEGACLWSVYERGLFAAVDSPIV